MDTLELFKDITLTVAYLEPSNTIICNLQIECLTPSGSTAYFWFGGH